MIRNMLAVLLGLTSHTDRMAEETLLRKRRTNQALGQITESLRISRNGGDVNKALRDIKEVIKILQE